jgi:hypothetical protein
LIYFDLFDLLELIIFNLCVNFVAFFYVC